MVAPCRFASKQAPFESEHSIDHSRELVVIVVGVVVSRRAEANRASESLFAQLELFEVGRQRAGANGAR